MTTPALFDTTPAPGDTWPYAEPGVDHCNHFTWGWHFCQRPTDHDGPHVACNWRGTVTFTWETP